jgi:hypothetical protein
MAYKGMVVNFGYSVVIQPKTKQGCNALFTKAFTAMPFFLMTS